MDPQPGVSPSLERVCPFLERTGLKGAAPGRWDPQLQSLVRRGTRLYCGCEGYIRVSVFRTMLDAESALTVPSSWLLSVGTSAHSLLIPGQKTLLRPPRPRDAASPWVLREGSGEPLRCDLRSWGVQGEAPSLLARALRLFPHPLIRAQLQGGRKAAIRSLAPAPTHLLGLQTRFNCNPLISLRWLARLALGLLPQQPLHPPPLPPIKGSSRQRAPFPGLGGETPRPVSLAPDSGLAHLKSP